MDNREKYKVVVRDNLSLAVIESTEVFEHADSWITASLNEGYLLEKYPDTDAYTVEIIEV